MEQFKTEKMLFSPIKAIQERAEELGAVSLAQGIPKFLPPLEVRKAAVSAIERGLTDFYGPARGIPELRRKIAETHLKSEGSFYNPDSEVLVTAGALQGLAVALATLLGPKDELIVLTPSYFPFLNLPQVLNIRPVYVSLKEPDWRLDGAALTRAVTPRTKAILICHPNNPTGTVYTAAELAQILEIAQSKDLWVLTDEVYRFFTYDTPYSSIGGFKEFKNRIIRLMSFSKAFSLSGWRVGYLLGDAAAVGELSKVHEMMVTASASLPAQYASLAALEAEPSIPERFRQILIPRRNRMLKRLQNLSEHFEIFHPQGAYYFFVKLRNEADDRAFAHRLLEEAGVAVVPGSTFGEAGKGYLRLSFAAKEGEIDEAFDRLERYLRGKSAAIPLEVEQGINRVTGVTDDSRLVKKGNVFVAVTGANFDGHDFIPDAVKKGALYIVGERDLKISSYHRVCDARETLGQLSSLWQGQPSQKLKVIGVTGTDGKTTTSHLIGAVLNGAGVQTSVCSTINVPGAHTTTPSAPVLQELLGRAVKEGDSAAVVEVTSHGIAQKRIAGTKFSASVLTNVTAEHLDYHETFERYRQTKGELFRVSPLAVLNRDDPSFDFFAQQATGKVVSYGFGSEADFRARDISLKLGKSRFKLVAGGKELLVNLPLPGEYNIQNALAAVAAATSLTGTSIGVAVEALENFNPASLVGRFQKVVADADISVIIDFAHTPNGLAQILNYAARIKPAGARLLVVFGAAGERDRYKRPEMGAIASRTADLVVLTAEDPRSEDPQAIIDAISQGCFKEGAVEGKNFVRIPDRRRAIVFALGSAQKGDWVLVLGKGHESTMNIGGIEYPWSDLDVIKQELLKIR